MKSIPQQNRLFYLDCLRLIATVGVIALHATSKQWYRSPIDSIQWDILNLYDTLVRCCVPLFFMISGTLFLNPRRTITVCSLFQKNIRRLVTAFFFWSSFYAIILAHRGVISSEWVYFHRQVIVGHYHLWFLYTLCGIYLMVPLLRKIASDRESLEYFLLLSFLFVPVCRGFSLFPFWAEWITTLQARTNLYLVLGYTGYFALGYYLYGYPLSRPIQFLVHGLAMLSLGFTYIGTHHLSTQMGEAVGILYDYQLPTTYIVAVSVYVFIQNGQIPPLVQRVARFLTPYTFGIYLIHDYFLVLFLEEWDWISCGISPLFTVPLFTTMVFIASFLAIWLLSQIPLLKKWIL